MSSTTPPAGGDPFPEAVDLALAEAVRLADPADVEGVDGESPVEVSAEELADLFRDVDAALLVQAHVPTEDWSDGQVVDALAAAERAARAATARGLRLAAELAGRRPAPSRVPDDEGLSKYALDEIGFATGLARGAARGRLADARVVTRRLPGLLDALEAGLIAPAGLRKVAELTYDLTDGGARAVQRSVLRHLGKPFLPDLHRASLEQMLALDPDLARSIAARATTRWIGHRVRECLKYLEAERKARQFHAAQRRVVVEPGPGGTSWLAACGPQAVTQAAYTRIDTLAHALSDPDDQRTLGQKRSDVFFDLILGRADHAPGQPAPADDSLGAAGEPAAPSGGWGASQVSLNVLIDHTRCTPKNAGGCVGEAGRFGPVTAESLTELVALATDTGGAVSGGHALPEPCPGDAHHQEHGQGPYEPGEALKRQVRGRWRRCTFPGCHRPARDCDLDHAIPYSRGGPTCICNLAPQCEHHHQLKHDHPTDWPPWRLVNHGDHLTWTSPTGLAVHVTPDPPDPHPPPAPRPVETPPPF